MDVTAEVLRNFIYFPEFFISREMSGRGFLRECDRGAGEASHSGGGRGRDEEVANAHLSPVRL